MTTEHYAMILGLMKLREEFLPTILELVKNASKTGEPAVRYMEYVFPGQGFEKVIDQFCLGDDIIVAPVLTKGARDARYRSSGRKVEGSPHRKDIRRRKDNHGRRACRQPADNGEGEIMFDELDPKGMISELCEAFPGVQTEIHYRDDDEYDYLVDDEVWRGVHKPTRRECVSRSER